MNEQTAAAIPEAVMPSPLRLILTLGVIAMLSGFIIVLVDQITAGPIARNQRQALERAVFTVLPGAESRALFRADPEGIHPLADDELEQANLFGGYDAEGRLVGVALEASARGYGGVIRVLYGFDPDAEQIIGYTVLQSSETPGLGDKIETDPNFLANFEALDVSLDPNTGEVANPIVTVKESEKTHPWEIDGISGATVSTDAVGRALRDSTLEWVPRIVSHLEFFKQAAREEN